MQNEDSDKIGALGGNLISFSKYFNKLTASEEEEYEERAAIMEYDGCLTQKEAEIEALRNVIANRK